MKKFIKNLILSIVIITSLTALSGCGKILNNNKETEKNKTSQYNAYIIPWTSYNSESELEEKIIITSKEELNSFCNKLEEGDYTTGRVMSANETFAKYDENYFKTKSLAILTVWLSNSGENIKDIKATKDGNNVKVEYEITPLGKNGESYLMVMSKEYIVIEVDKDITNINAIKK